MPVYGESPVLNLADSINNGLLGFWPLGTNQRQVDIGPRRLHAGPINSPGTALGPVGRSASYNGASYHRSSELIWPANAGATVSFWVYVDSASTGNSAFAVGSVNDDGGKRFQAHFPYGGDIHFDFVDFSSGRISTPFPAYNTWFHVVLVNNGANFKGIYINGKLAASSATTAGTMPNQLVGLDIGKWTAVTGLEGYMAFFRLHTRGLNSEEAERLYADRWAGVMPRRKVFKAAAVASSWSSSTVWM